MINDVYSITPDRLDRLGPFERAVWNVMIQSGKAVLIQNNNKDKANVC
jgi:hypothetical protein